ITPSTVIYAPGSLKFGRRIYHDHLRRGHGHITVYDAIERSSNIFFYKMGIALGIDKIHSYASLFGLGQLTHIKLSNEVPGLMPSRAWKLKAFGEEWQPGENLSNAIGQGFVLTTALQMAIAYNAIGLEGKVVKPFLVKKIINYSGQVLQEFSPHIVRDISQTPENPEDTFIEKKYFKVVKEAMRRVANGEHGTARWWKIPGGHIQIA
ncbi:MAG: penicillin-binding protein 2, partial [Bdellovibrionales bacterium]|nr:penicillin-binding protein 2 [Bdellovibrionales bacterium]